MWANGFWGKLFTDGFWPGYSSGPVPEPVDLTKGLIFSIEYPVSLEFNIEFVNEE